MTAAEKADELVSRFGEQVERYQAKEFAGIVVEEVRATLFRVFGSEQHTWTEHQLSEIVFWNTVIVEIKKL